MNLDWRNINEALYVTTGPDGELIELALDYDDDGWYVTSDAAQLAGIGYLGEDALGAMHLTAALLRPRVRSWTIHGTHKVELPGVVGEGLSDDDLLDGDVDPTGARWWGKVLRQIDLE